MSMVLFTDWWRDGAALTGFCADCGRRRDDELRCDCNRVRIEETLRELGGR